jgi:hypothetical protein
MASSTAVSSFVPTGVRLICRLAGVAAIACSALLIGAVAAVLARGLQANIPSSMLGHLGSNWLVTLFKLHYKVDGITSGMLHGIRLTDMAILALTAIMGVGLWFMLHSTSMTWSFVGMALPITGIIIYIITQLAGRSAVMAAVLVFSLVALWSPVLGRLVPYIGILAAALLLLGDFTEPLHSKFIAALIATGYVLFAVWFVLVGIRMIRIR